MDQLEAMRVFVAIAGGGSLSAAARALGVPVASVSRKLAALEKQVGARLLSRTTRRIALTEAGQRYLATCRRILAELEEADRSLRDDGVELHGALAITAPVVFGRLHVLPVVVEFLRAHPRVDVRLRLDDRNAELVADGVDVAVRIGSLGDSSLVATRAGEIRRIACASPGYLRERGTPDAPEQLAGHDCITLDALASPERWVFRGPAGPRGVAVRSRLTVTTAEAAVDAALAGLGVASVLCYQAAAALKSGALVEILERFQPPPAPVHVLHGEGRAPRRKVRDFAKLAALRLRAALAG